MNKIIGIFIVMLLFFSLIPIANSLERDIQENHYKIKDDINFFDNEDCECESDIESQIIAFERHKYYDILDQNESLLKPTIIENLPDYFSWLDFNGQDWTTPAKDQGNCGSCWDFAAIGGLEAIISIRENCSRLDPDLSEQYVLSCLSGAGSCNGGYGYRAYRYMLQNNSWGNYCNGIIPEFCFPYKANDEIPCDEKISNWMDYLIPISDYGRWYPDGENDRDAIKSQIMEHGPVLAVMLFTYYIDGPNNLEEWGWTHNSPNDYYSYPGPTDDANHLVVLVGWKDDPNIGNGGYWIIKNSCSSEWGYNGFFNIEYGSLNIESIEIDWVEYDPDLYNNWIPKVYSGGIYYGSVNEEINFDGSYTVDPDEDIINYQWDFGDGIQKNGVAQTHSYNMEGIYSITLNVTDSNGNVGIDKTWAFIDRANSPPDTPILEGRKIGQKYTEYEYSFYAYDPDDDDIYYYLNWGDTYWTGSWHPWIGPYKSGETVTLTNIWDTTGEYIVRVKAKDIYEAKSNWAELSVLIPKNRNIQNPLLRLINYFQLFAMI